MKSQFTPEEPLYVLGWAAVSTKAQDADDKLSIPNQIAEIKSFCEELSRKEQREVVLLDMIVIRGHSRKFRTLEKLIAGAKSPEVRNELTRFVNHLENGDFDILVCRDANRFARKASMLYEIVDMVIEDCNARIYSYADGWGWIDRRNVSGWLAIKGYETEQQSRWLAESMQEAKLALIEQGLPSNGHPVWSHKIVRDEKTGKALKLIVDEDKRAILYHAALLLLEESCSWAALEIQLFERYGHGENGKPFPRNKLYWVFNDPWAWGNSAWNFRNPSSPVGQRVGLWIHDETVSPPEGVKIKRGTHESLFAGEFGSRVRAEIIRRMRSVRGNARPYSSHKFSGLVVCGNCHHHMVFNSNNGYPSWRCQSKFWASSSNAQKCPKQWTVAERKIQNWLTDKLLDMIETQQPDMLARSNEKAEVGLIESLTEEIAKVDAQIKRLITEQSSAPESVQDFYREQIRDLAGQLKTLRATLQVAKQDESRQNLVEVQNAFDDLQAYENIEAFWEEDEKTINQLLHRLMGNRCLVIADGMVTGTMKAP